MSIKRILYGLLVLAVIFSLAACSNESKIQAGENLLDNADFEDANYLASWDKLYWFTIPELSEITQSIGYNGSQNAVMIQNHEENDTRISQRVDVIPRKVYRLSGYIKAVNIQGGQGANLSFENMFIYAGSLSDTQGEWQYVEVYGKTAPKQRHLSVLARVGGYGQMSAGTAYFDQIRLEVVKDVPDGVYVHELKEQEQKSSTSEEEDGIKFLQPTLIISFLLMLFFVWLYVRMTRGKAFVQNDSDHWYRNVFVVMLVLGLGIRILLAVTVTGYPNDMACWQAWARISAEGGLFNLYNGDIFIDYPPGYMYVLYVIGLIMKIPLVLSQQMSWLLVKIPSMLTDMAAAFMLYTLIRKEFNSKAALILASVYFLSPAIIVNSSAWGQIDSILALMVLLYVINLHKGKFVIAGVALAVGVLLKPQMILFAPLYITAANAYRLETSWKEMLIKTAKGVGAGLLAFALIVLPFALKQDDPFWIFNLYFKTVTSYESVSLNACNVWALQGAMWRNVDEPFLGLTYNFWGYAGLVLSVAIFFLIALQDRKRENVYLHGALLITGIFVLSGKMHERYMYAAMILLLVSFVRTKRISHLMLFGLFTITQFANTALVLANQYIFSQNIWTVVISIMAVIGYGILVWISVDAMNNRDHYQPIDYTRSKEKKTNKKSPMEKSNMIKRLQGDDDQPLFRALKRRDYLIMAVLTVVYAIIALVNLGNVDGPQTMWNVNTSKQTVLIDLGEQRNIQEVMYFRAQATRGANFHLSYADESTPDQFLAMQYVEIISGGEYSGEDGDVKRSEIRSQYDMPEGSTVHFSDYPAIFKWYSMPCDIQARYIRLSVNHSMIRLVETAFKDTDGNVIDIASITPLVMSHPEDAQLLFDEQHTVPERETYMNSTYFDEIYHAGTAWEHIMRYSPYETTHPPLGKVIMSWGIQIFGMTPFGWRIMGTLVGILMIPAMYLLAFVIFGKTQHAMIATTLLTFDVMHFVQTRIATIDSYGVFFIILMYLCMAIYYKMNFYKVGLKRSLVPLFFSGLFFGMGAASKWICLYAGAGLAVIFFYTIYQRFVEYRFACSEEGKGMDPVLRQRIKESFIRYTLITLALCILFFIVIPGLIYVASYIPYMQVDESIGLDNVWQNQVNMFNYHSGLSDDHPYASPWYEWPLIIKPMWYYYGSYLSGTGQMSSIAAFGNPAVWWIGTIAVIWMFFHMILDEKKDRMKLFVVIAFLSQFLPWVLVPRSMFIYHYFASVPFIILMIVYMIRKIQDKTQWDNKFIYVYLGIVILLFALFYPAMTGTIVSSSWGQLMKWLPTWWFTY